MMSNSQTPLDFTTELARALPYHADKILVIKALPDEDFTVVLSALQQIFPGASITSLVFTEGAGPQDEVGEVLRPSLGKKTLWRRLRQGFDICVAAVNPPMLGGSRLFVMDLVAAVSGSQVKVYCSSTTVVRRQHGWSLWLAPLFSGLTLVGAFLLTVLWAGLSFILLAAALGLGGVAKIFRPEPAFPSAEEEISPK